MGKSNLLSCLAKRDLLNRSNASVKDLLIWGERYEEEGMINDAIDFYEKADAGDALERLLPLARDEGDVFLLGRLLKALNREAEAREWLSLGEKASELGKTSFAREAFRRGGRDVPEATAVDENVQSEG
ncbi:MAG: hypothetical protein LLG06_14365 [Desulfobacteraceae bacterium]|nr:hypothetical protein [Desulfobacteraceae bacterium]